MNDSKKNWVFEETQRPGGWMLYLNIFGTLSMGVAIVFVWVTPTPQMVQWIMTPSAILFFGIMALFSRMQTQVSDREVRFQYGWGWPGKVWNLSEIDTVEKVVNPWYYGWGMRLIPGGTLYNITGFDALEFRMKNGKMFRLGTQQQQAFYDAVSPLFSTK